MTERIRAVIETLKNRTDPLPGVDIPLLIKSLEELQSMIGLEEIKKSIIQQVKHAIFFSDDPDPEVLYNVIITGPPGVGKTLLIQILAKIWSSIELVDPHHLHSKKELHHGSRHTVWWLQFVNQQIEQINDELGEEGYSSPETHVDVHQRLNWVHETCTELVACVPQKDDDHSENERLKICYVRRDMAIGTHQGETAKWTYDLLKSAIGGVVVLDEFYRFINGQEGNDDFGIECVNTINQFITDHPTTRFIIAGYEENIQKSIFRFQPGLQSRFPWTFKIEGYKPEELTDMFLKRFTLRLEQNVTKKWISKLIKNKPCAFSSFGRSVVQFSFRVGVIVSDRAFDENKTRKDILVTKKDFLDALSELTHHLERSENLSMYS